jgi:hypothetical protein
VVFLIFFADAALAQSLPDITKKADDENLHSASARSGIFFPQYTPRKWVLYPQAQTRRH